MSLQFQRAYLRWVYRRIVRACNQSVDLPSRLIRKQAVINEGRVSFALCRYHGESGRGDDIVGFVSEPGEGLKVWADRGHQDVVLSHDSPCARWRVLESNL